MVVFFYNVKVFFLVMLFTYYIMYFLVFCL